jgi:predicted MFS family arabinose efflux permease
MINLRPLHSSSFRHLAAAYWVNEFGNWIGEIALTLLVYDRTHSPIATACLFLALRILPALLAPLLTVRVETLPARAILTSLYVLEAVFFAGIAWLTHHFSLAAVLSLGGLDGLLAVTASALTRGATANELLKRDLLRDGNGILNLGSMLSTAGSPIIAGGLVAWRGPGPALLVDAGTFLVTAVVIATAPALNPGNDVTATFARRLNDISEILGRDASLRILLVTIALVMLASAVPIPIEVVFAKRSLHVGDSGYGLLLGSWGAGMVLGGGIFAVGRNLSLSRLLVAGTLLAAVGYVGLALSPTLAVACVSSAVGGIGNGAAWVAAVTAVQERIPASAQSAIMSMVQGLNQVMPAIGFVAGGVVTAAFSPRIAYGIAALGIALVVFAGSLLMVRANRGRIHLVEVPKDGQAVPAGVQQLDPQTPAGLQQVGQQTPAGLQQVGQQIPAELQEVSLSERMTSPPRLMIG